MIGKGLHGLECISLLYALKIKYPEHIYLLRGKHETEVSRHHRFYYQNKVTLSIAQFRRFNSSFDYLSLAAVIGDTFAVHSGISTLLNELHDIEALQRPISSDVPLVTDLLWSNAFQGDLRWGPGSTYGGVFK